MGSARGVSVGLVVGDVVVVVIVIISRELVGVIGCYLVVCGLRGWDLMWGGFAGVFGGWNQWDRMGWCGCDRLCFCICFLRLLGVVAEFVGEFAHINAHAFVVVDAAVRVGVVEVCFGLGVVAAGEVVAALFRDGVGVFAGGFDEVVVVEDSESAGDVGLGDANELVFSDDA